MQGSIISRSLSHHRCFQYLFRQCNEIDIFPYKVQVPIFVNICFFCLTTLPNLLQSKFHLMNHIFDEFDKKQYMDKLLHGKDKNIWWKAIGNEIGRLAQGIGSLGMVSSIPPFMGPTLCPTFHLIDINR